MCSWCWGYRPVWQKLRAALPAQLPVVYVLGGLARDTDQPMPAELQETIRQHWHTIQQKLGSEFNFEFWARCQPRRDTYKACRAVLVARRQGREEAMIEAIQRAYYLRAMNPSEPRTLVQLAGEIGLSEEDFAKALVAPDTEDELQAELALRRALGVRSFPSLVLEVNGVRQPIAHDYHDPVPTLAAIRAALAG